MVQVISRAQAQRMLMRSPYDFEEEDNGNMPMAEDMDEVWLLSNDELAQRINEECALEEDDEDRYEVSGDDDYREPTLDDFDDRKAT